MDTSAHDVMLVAGTQRVKLKRVHSGILQQVRREHPILAAVPDAHLTHYVQDLAMPADTHQLCYLQRVARKAKDGNWDMALLFYHHPTFALLEAQRRGRARAGDGLPPVPVKWASYGLDPAHRMALNDPVGEEMLQEVTSQAVALVAGHPELASLEPNSAADIQTNIIGTQSTTAVLGQVLADQGPATTSGGWATLTPLINSATGQPYANSQGQIQYMPQWSQTTAQFAGAAISPALDTVKDDTTLGINVTTIDPTTITTNDPTAPTNGKIWTLHDGVPTVDQSPTAGLRASGPTYTVQNQSPSAGYSVTVTGVDSSGNVTIQITNRYVRYLGLYIRYLDANGQPILLSTVADDIKNAFFFWPSGTSTLNLNGTYDAFLDLVNQQFVLLGMPVGTNTDEYTFPLPPAATSALILAGGLGRGSNPYPDTLSPGKVMTIIFDLTLPLFFLALAAAPGFASLAKELENAETLAIVLELVIPLFADLLTAAIYDDPDVFKELAVGIGEKLLSAGAGKLDAMIAAAIAEGESEEAVTDAVPVVGLFLSAVFAIGIIAQVTETSAEVAQSPNTYADEVTFTHDVVVTISHDPNDPAGFPATAASFTVTAEFDNGTPHKITQALPGTTVTSPITVIFSGVPFGGMVTVNVGFYSADGWLAGQGGIGPVPNAAGSCTTLTPDGSLSCQTSQSGGDLSVSFAITENLVPLTNATTYSHQEVIVLGADGEHAWQATTTPPTEVTPQGLCENVNGQLCALGGITISTINAAVGYAWQAYDQGVVDCASGTTGQLYRFANLSVTQDPQSGYLFSGCGFSGAVRIVYDLLGKQDWNFYLDSTTGKGLIRQIRLSGNSPSFDGPTSNLAWGQLQFPSDALLLHPLGKIISINSALHKLEVLDLPPAAVPDAEAPQSQVYSGVGTREGRMKGPLVAALTAQGTILILETQNNRIQAFDLGGNPAPVFAGGAYFVPLHDGPSGVNYLDLGVEYSGYMYVLSYTGSPGSLVYRLDIYTPKGAWLARTTGVNAAKLAVNYWRDLFTLNYQPLTLPGGSPANLTEPSVSHWLPSTP